MATQVLMPGQVNLLNEIEGNEEIPFQGIDPIKVTEAALPAIENTEIPETISVYKSPLHAVKHLYDDWTAYTKIKENEAVHKAENLYKDVEHLKNAMQNLLKNKPSSKEETFQFPEELGEEVEALKRLGLIEENQDTLSLSDCESLLQNMKLEMSILQRKAQNELSKTSNYHEAILNVTKIFSRMIEMINRFVEKINDRARPG